MKGMILLLNADTLARFMWATRQRIHGNWPEDGPLSEQPEMVRDWVMQEAEAVLEFITKTNS